MKYKYELHCHTGCVSQCGRVQPEEIVKLYKKKGYNGIVVTDHYSPLTFRPNWCPQKQVDFYLDGYRRMKKAAGEDFNVLLGMELRHYGTANDYLVYGVEDDFLYSAGNLMVPWEKKAFKMLHDRGYMIFQAHPFRPGIRRCNPELIDGIEVYNGKCNRKENEKAMNWARENNLLVCSGSDFHTIKNLALGGIETDEPINNNDDLLRILKAQAFERIEVY